MATSPPPSLVELDETLAADWPVVIDDERLQRILIEAILRQCLPEAAESLLDLPRDEVTDSARSLARAAADACRAIERAARAEQERTVELAAAAGLTVAAVPRSRHGQGMQFPLFELRITAGELDRALRLFTRDGYLHWISTEGGAWQSFRRSRSKATLARADELSTRMVLSWRDEPRQGRLAAMLRPQKADYELVDLPGPLWPLYHLLRLGRRMLKPIPGRPRDLGPFLGTPEALIPALLEFAEVGARDVLVDLGCGDGRVVVEAARARGCRSIGFESSSALVEMARKRIADAGLDDRAEVRLGNAARADLRDATVVFLFLGAEQLAALLPGVRRKLAPGSRIVTHEQAPLDRRLEPVARKPIIAQSSLTVARLWRV